MLVSIHYGYSRCGPAGLSVSDHVLVDLLYLVRLRHDSLILFQTTNGFLTLLCALRSMMGSACLPIVALLFLWMPCHASADNDLQQTLAISKMELLGDLAWWVTAGDDNRKLARDDDMNETTGTHMITLDDKALIDVEKELVTTPSMVRRTQSNTSTTAVTVGFCLPSIATSSADFGNCRTESQGCNSSAFCCRGLTCQSGKCQAVCQGAGIQCSTDEPCCSKQCVVCTSACHGRCGLGKKLSKDDIQVRLDVSDSTVCPIVADTCSISNLQIFYYPWYASVPDDGYWRHWAIDARPEGGVYDPSHQDIPANHYPRLGPYSSRTLDVINMHMRWIARAGIGTIVVSWWGKGSFEDDIMPKILNLADDWGLKVAFYIEAYGGGYVRTNPSTGQTVGSRTPQTAMKDVKYLIDRYGCHRAIYRQDGRPVFMFFAARSYKDGDQTEWKQVWDMLHADRADHSRGMGRRS